MKGFLASKPGKASAAAFLLLLVFWVVLRVKNDAKMPALLEPILLALILTAVLWVAIDLGYRAWQQRRQRSFDAKLAAREGIDDRKREWAEWTNELRRQGIDRYQLPFYLLLGEPQSGKSILLRNSDLYFPFGQNRLSGVGGTKGCDWWFTDQAVILDLAGRLFTHEGGASDEAEWKAFLGLLADYRPQCPANGVILVLPCDGLAGDAEPAIARKAARMQAALTTLTDELQARLPVYVVLTKGDKVFGFAECVHRLDAPKRHEMFGWSRPLEKLEAPFDVAEAQGGFQGVVERARLLRAQMLATARLPEALGEVDRFYAFPEELAALWPTLSLYLQRVFTESRLIDKLFFRGVYLTSGLQSGAPIAKVCAELMGTPGEADRRNLEGLFVKQRAYFIKDLVRERIFTEQGLVRPTKQRVLRARRNARLAYGVAGAGALISLFWTSTVVAKESSDETRLAVGDVFKTIEEARVVDDPRKMMAGLAMLDDVVAGLGVTPYATVADALAGFREDTLEHIVPGLALQAAQRFTRETDDPAGFSEFERQTRFAQLLLSPELGGGGLELLLAFLGEGEARGTGGCNGCSLRLSPAEKATVRERADRLWDGTLQAGSGWARPGPLGVVLACQELFSSGQVMRRLGSQDDCDGIRRRTHALDLLFQSQKTVGLKDGVARNAIGLDLDSLEEARDGFLESTGIARDAWARLDEVRSGVAAVERFVVPKEALALLSNEVLGDVCRPSFLAPDPSRLPLDLARPPPAGNADALEHFQAKLKCAGNAYMDAFGNTARLRERLRIKDPAHVFDAGFSVHLGNMLAALSAFPGSEWGRHVAKLVDEYEAGLLHAWVQDPSLLEGELERHLGGLGLAVDTPGRGPWLRSVVEQLAARFGATVPEAAEHFSRLSDHASQLEFTRPLRGVAEELSRRQPSAADQLSRQLVEARAAAKDPPPTGAGAFVELCYRALCERAFELRIRLGFEEELVKEIGDTGGSRGLIEALWSPSGCEADLAYFDRGGALDQLRERYRLEASPLPGAEPAVAGSSRAEWTLDEFSGSGKDWEVVGFLLDLQAFLLAGDPEKKRAAGSTVKVEVKCDPDSPAFSPKWMGYFYVHAGTKSDYEFTGQKMKALSVPWSFGSDSDFRFRWCDSDKQLPEDLDVRRSGPLAPLLLAWESSQASKREWHWHQPLENGFEARLSLSFEWDLPRRPERPSFAGE